MRKIPVQSETIQIASVGGERRLISVSGFSKARLLWLFRNFRILNFSVLNSKQQRLVAQAWYTGKSGDIADDPLDLIGAIDGFLPKLYPLCVSATQKPDRLRASFRTPAILTAVILLLGSVIYLAPKHRVIPQPPVATATTNPVSATVRLVPPIPAELTPPVTQAPVVVPQVSTVVATVPPRHLPDAMASGVPDAMASGVSSLPVNPPEIQVNTKSAGRREVMIRVSVNHQGQAERFEVLQGDRGKISAALEVAKAWHFQPCSSADVCEHTLRVKNYEDASIVQMID